MALGDPRVCVWGKLALSLVLLAAYHLCAVPLETALQPHHTNPWCEFCPALPLQPVSLVTPYWDPTKRLKASSLLWLLTSMLPLSQPCSVYPSHGLLALLLLPCPLLMLTPYRGLLCHH